MSELTGTQLLALVDSVAQSPDPVLELQLLVNDAEARL